MAKKKRGKSINKENKSKRVHKMQAKLLERKLINSNDEVVVEALPENLDASNVDIKSVVKNMDDSENMAEVVLNNFDEIIEQNTVRDTLEYLDDSDVAMILKQKREILKKQQKMANAIKAIADNDKKLKVVLDNLKGLSDLEVTDIMESLNPEPVEERKEYIKRQEVKIVGKKIMENIVKYKIVLHIRILTEHLDDDSKKLLLDLCLRSMDSCEKEKNIKINSKVKTKFVYDLLMTTDLAGPDRAYILKKYIDNGILTNDEKNHVWQEMEKIRVKREGENKYSNLELDGRGEYE